MSNAKDVFIGYASEDRPRALKIYRALTDNGFSAWIDVVDLVPGQDWGKEIDKAIHGARIFLACISFASLKKRGYVQVELKRAFDVMEMLPERQVYVIPVFLDDYWEDVPDWIHRLHWVHYYEDDGPARLLAAIRFYLERGDSTDTEAKARKNLFVDLGVAEHWVHLQTPPRSPWVEICPHNFVLPFELKDADPTFDATILNITERPMVLTDIGVEVVDVFDSGERYAEMPRAVEIKTSASYRVVMPNIVERALAHAGSSVAVNLVVSERLPDPLYFEAGAPFRFRLLLYHYYEAMPTDAILRLWGRVNNAGMHSEKIYLSKSF